MPTYVYECSSCNTQFEVLQRITEDPIDTCECGAKGTVKRLIQPIAVVFKGSGFHINDYSPGGAEDKKPASSTTAAESKPAEAKPIETSAPATPAPASTSTEATA